MRGLWVAGAVALAVAGCQSRAEAPVAMSTSEFCARVGESLAARSVDPAVKAALTEKARNAGCFGPPQPQTVIVR